MNRSTYLSSPLRDGWVTHWLVAGPHAMALPPDSSGDPSELAAYRNMISKRHPGEASGIDAPPVQLGTFVVGKVIAQEGMPKAATDQEPHVWELHTCYEDPFIHVSAGPATPAQLISWAYVELISPAAQVIQAALFANGPTDVWCEDEHIQGTRDFAQPLPGETTLSLSLTQGPNRLLIRFEQLGYGPTPYLLALRLDDAKGLTLRLPSSTRAPATLQALETLFGLAALDRDSFTADTKIAIRWPADLREQADALGSLPEARILLRLQKADGRIYAETRGTPRPGEATETVPGHHVVPGTYQAVLMPAPEAFAADRLRVQRVFDIEVLGTPVRKTSGSEGREYVKRLYDAVQMAMRLKAGLLSELAAMTLGAWRYVDSNAIRGHIEAVNDGAVDRDRLLLALLGMRVRFAGEDSFPTGLADDIDAVLTSLPSVMHIPADEAGACLRGTLAILAGQVYPEHGKLRVTAETGMQAWLFTKGRYGLETLTDDGDALDTLIFGLSHLADLAEEALTRELAAVLLDKILFTVAINSFHGTGSGGLQGTTASLSHVLWGAGVTHRHLWSVVGLANARAYPIPPLVADIVRDLIREDLEPFTQEEHHLDPGGAWAYARLLYRTPEMILTSTSGSKAGRPYGTWRAVLGSEAVVSVNHPAHAGRAALEGCGFWHGDRTAPHMAQRGDSLLVQYDVLGGDPLGFTHAHFPLYAFDEYILREGWAFARKGTAYIGLTASSPVTLETSGPGAHRELRAGGAFTTWLCQMGRAAEDGDFAAFQGSVLAAPVSFGARSVRWTTLRGETLAFAWESDLAVEGGDSDSPPTEQGARAHYATPYCTIGFPAEHIEIRLNDTVLRLDFTD
jgi:hypothetical protein